jgi:hypothetical protein
MNQEELHFHNAYFIFPPAALLDIQHVSVRNKLNFCILFKGGGLGSIPGRSVTFEVDKMALGQVSVVVLNFSNDYHSISAPNS